jgi:hypothetical protein
MYNPSLQHSMLIDFNSKEQLTKRFNYSYESVQYGKGDNAVTIRKLSFLHPTRALQSVAHIQAGRSYVAEARWLKLSTSIDGKTRQIQNLWDLPETEATRGRVEANQTSTTDPISKQKKWTGLLSVVHPALKDDFGVLVQTTKPVTSSDRDTYPKGYSAEFDVRYSKDAAKSVIGAMTYIKQRPRNAEVNFKLLHIPSTVNVTLSFVHNRDVKKDGIQQRLVFGYCDSANESNVFTYTCQIGERTTNSKFISMNVTTPAGRMVSVYGVYDTPKARRFDSTLRVSVDEFVTLANVIADGYQKEIIGTLQVTPNSKFLLALY